MVDKNAQSERHLDARPPVSETRESTSSWWSELWHSGNSQESLLRAQSDSTRYVSHNRNLPKLQLFEYQSSENRIGKSLLLDDLRNRDRTIRPEIQHDGRNITRFVDLNGNEYTRRGDHYFNTRNPLQKDGVLLRFDQNGDVRMKDRESGIVRTTSADGVETTDYAAVHGGKTIRTIEGNIENISLEDRGGRHRSLVLERNSNGAMVRSYTDGSGTTFTHNNERNGDGKPLYTAVDKDGHEVGRNYTVNADRSGNVLVNNYDQPDSPQFAHRELNNGMTVSSGKTTDSRVVTDADGRQLDANSAQVKSALRTEMISEAPASFDMERSLQTAAGFRRADGMLPVGGTVYVSSQFRTLFDGGDWDPKAAGAGNNVANMEYEAYGNWLYGYLGRASGLTEGYLREQAGRFQHVSDPSWGRPGFLGFGGTGTQGDDPEDVKYMDRGFASYRAEHPEHARESLQASQTSMLLRLAAGPFSGLAL